MRFSELYKRAENLSEEANIEAERLMFLELTQGYYFLSSSRLYKS